MPSGISSPISTDNAMARPIYEPYEVRNSTGQRSRVLEAWYVYNLPPGDTGKSALISLPQIGTSHPDFNVTVQQQYLLRRVGQTAAIYIVDYGIPLYGGAQRDSSYSYSLLADLTIPSYKADGPNWVFNPLKEKLPETRLQLTYYVSATVQQVEAAARDNVGKVTFITEGFGETWYQFLGYTTSQRQGELMRVDYLFRRDAATAKVDKGTIPGSDVDIPAKPPLYSFHHVHPFVLLGVMQPPLVYVINPVQKFGFFQYSELLK